MGRVVRIGNVAWRAREWPQGAASALVPRRYLPAHVSPGGVSVDQGSTLDVRHDVGSGLAARRKWWAAQLQWMVKKHSLGQDMFLMGPPSRTRRDLALGFCELLGLESEMVVLNRDVTESDLKQRREIGANGSVEFVDAAPLRAALNGRVLILDGVEKAERNVLPALNNLLENREMHLVDGRKLIASSTFDYRVKELGITPDIARNQLGLERAHEDFRVVALGLPVPPYTGFPLDPPLRSRFQCHYVQLPVFWGSDFKATSSGAHDHSEKDIVASASQVVKSIRAVANSSQNLRNKLFGNLPEDALSRMHMSMHDPSGISLVEALHRTFPNEHILRDESEQRQVLEEILDPVQDKKLFPMAHPPDYSKPGFASCPALDRCIAGATYELENGMGVCIVGPPGSGKSTIANRVISLSNQTPVVVNCFKDMSSKDLLASRATNPDGSTTWAHSALVKAAESGDVVVLDGVHRLQADTLASLAQLLHSGDLTLPNGTRLLQAGRFDEVAKTGQEMKDMVRVDPSFKVVALGCPPKRGELNWLSAEVLTMFSFFDVPALPYAVARDAIAITSKANVPPRDIDALIGAIRERGIGLNFIAQEEVAIEANNSNFQLSLRQTARLLGAIVRGQDLDELISRALLLPFRSQAERDALEEKVSEVGEFKPPATDYKRASVESLRNENAPGNVARELVPKVDEFVEMPHQMAYLETICDDLHSGEHVLLIGNQGVGKNKIVDKMLQRLNLPREYLQLSRDSTVQSLTVTPSLQDGRIVFIDSPLVRAARSGHILVVDEADKAAVEVVTVLKGLLTDNQMRLPDGRIILGEGQRPPGNLDTKLVIPLHPSFRLICLANRPGFPFLGENFFRELGDCFSTHIVGNGTLEDQKMLLRSFAPNLAEDKVEALATSFQSLREFCDQGVIKYPYSTREAAAVARHIERFPEDSVQTVLRNVFDFDSHDNDAMEVISDTFARNGIHVGGHSKNPLVVDLAPQKKMSPALLEKDLGVAGASDLGEKLEAFELTTTDVSYLVTCEPPRVQDGTSGRIEGRVSRFSEEIVRFDWAAKASVVGAATPLAVCSTENTVAHVLSKQPAFLSTTSDVAQGAETTWNTNVDKLIGTGVDVILETIGDTLPVLLAPKLGCLWVIGEKGQVARKCELPAAFLGKPAPKTRFIGGLAPLFSVSNGSDGNLVLKSAHGTLKFDKCQPRAPKDLQASLFPASECYMQKQNQTIHMGQGLVVTLTGQGGDQLTILDATKETQRTISLDHPVLDLAKMGENRILALLSDGTVSLIEVDPSQTQAALESWLETSSGEAAVDDLEIEVVDTSSVGSLGDLEVATSLEAGTGPAISGSGTMSTGRGSGSSSGGSGGKVGSGGGGGEGAPIDRSDGWGGYELAKLSALEQLSASERANRGLPITSAEAQALEEEQNRLNDASVKVLASQIHRAAMKDLESGSGRGAVLYKEAKAKVERQIKELRLILEAQDAKEKERTWLGNKLHGELDENRLVEGLVGDANVFKRRGIADVKTSMFQRLPKRMLFVLDTSASMARANDDRLQHLLQSVVMVMECMDGFQQSNKYQVGMTCHSGSGSRIPLISFGDWPKSETDKKRICTELVLNARSAVTGDNTLQAAKQAIEDVKAGEDADDYFVVLISDANLGRYQISPQELSEVLLQDPEVNAYTIFIAEPEASAWLSKRLPPGKSYSCLDAAMLPKAFAAMFEDALVQDL